MLVFCSFLSLSIHCISWRFFVPTAAIITIIKTVSWLPLSHECFRADQVNGLRPFIDPIFNSGYTVCSLPQYVKRLSNEATECYITVAWDATPTFESHYIVLDFCSCVSVQDCSLFCTELASVAAGKSLSEPKAIMSCPRTSRSPRS